MTANTKADAIIAAKMALLTAQERAAIRIRFERCLTDPVYSEQIRLARKPVVSQAVHLRQARDLIDAIDSI